MPNESEKIEIRSKMLQIYRFLQAFNEMKNPTCKKVEFQPWSLEFQDLPDYPTIKKGVVTQGDHGSDFILKVSRPEIQPMPEPDNDLMDWLQPGWSRPEVTPKIIEQKVEPIIEEEVKELEEDAPKTRIVRFTDDPKLPQLYDKWINDRKKWLDETKTPRKAIEIFERLYELYSIIERNSEQVELLVGDGMLVWNRLDGQKINHPVLLLRVQLTFNPDIPEFTIIESENLPELYTSLFRSMNDVIPGALISCIRELDENGWHPLGGGETSEYLKRLVSQLASEGQFQESPIQVKDYQSTPFMFRSTVLFARKRNMGYAIALEKILDHLTETEEFSDAVLKITGIVRDTHFQSNSIAPFLKSDINGEDEHILLSKESNSEQLQIAHALEQNNAVLVQGPPGTGKTHSIANLLGHLLSLGKSVLVTSHTTKALQVLREKVVEPLQPLCVSVLDDDNKSRQQMEGAIDVITDRLSNSDVNQLLRDAKVAEDHRNRILSQLRELRFSLKQARADEYRPIVIAGESYNPSDAARLVKDQAQMNQWIPGPVILGEPLPLSDEEIMVLYRTNQLVTIQDEQEFSGILPHPNDLMVPSHFEKITNEAKLLAKEDLGFRADLWERVPIEQTPEVLQELLQQVQQAGEFLQEDTDWKMQTILAGQGESLHRRHWDELNQEVEKVIELSDFAYPQLLKWGPELVLTKDSLSFSEAETIAEEICSHFQRGKSLSFAYLILNKKWKKLIDSSKVNGKKPEQLEQFQALHSMLKLTNVREQLKTRWERQVTSLGGLTVQSLGAEPEKVARQFMGLVQKCLAWTNERWLPLEKRLIENGFQWSIFRKEISNPLHVYGELHALRDAISKLPKVLIAQINRLAHKRVQFQLDNLSKALQSSSDSKADVVIRLEQAVVELDQVMYRVAYDRLIELHGLHSTIKDRRNFLERLSIVAPKWAEAILQRRGIHGESEPPEDLKSAWIWRQLHDELERRAHVSMEVLQQEITKLRLELRTVTAKLVENKAWEAQKRNTSPQQQSALQGWKSLMKKAGKRTGTRAPRLLSEARKLMPVCQSAVPVWIMPMNRVVENFDPSINSFDVVIIDEASQSDMMALTALYLGKQVIVVGDDEQVSPESVGTRNDELSNLIDTYLKGIPNAQLYDGISSIYDLAKTAFSMVGLKEHFRCVAPIIQFSNYLSYGGTIKPLRDASGIKTLPHTVAYRVEGGVNDNKLNENEAKTVASLLIAATEQEEYADATFGVISMFGDKQAEIIDLLLQKNMTAKEYQRRKIRCGNPAQFQGDERNIIFISMIYSPGESGPLNLLGDPGNRYKKRFNVAASRAQDQMWVVHSLDPEIDLKPDDIRRRLILHALNPDMSIATEKVEKRTESEFEKRVARLLLNAGYRVTPQWEVGAYRIDLVVEGNGKRLAIECDGDRWHPVEKLEEDMARQAILERLGWTFVRIRGSQFFRDPHNAMFPVFKRLETMGIFPNQESSKDEEPVLSELQDRVIRRAAEIRKEWEENVELFELPQRKKRMKKAKESSGKNILSVE